MPLDVLPPKLAQGAHGRQVGEAVGAKALHAPTFVVDRDQQISTDAFDVGTERGQLRTAVPVAAKQNHAAHERMRQTAAVHVGQCGAGNVDDQGGVLCHGVSIQCGAPARQIKAVVRLRSRPRKNWRRILTRLSR